MAKKTYNVILEGDIYTSVGKFEIRKNSSDTELKKFCEALKDKKTYPGLIEKFVQVADAVDTNG